MRHINLCTDVRLIVVLNLDANITVLEQTQCPIRPWPAMEFLDNRQFRF